MNSLEKMIDHVANDKPMHVGSYARTKSGGCTTYCSPDAKSFCAAGLIRRYADGDRVMRGVAGALGYHGAHPQCYVISWWDRTASKNPEGARRRLLEALRECALR